MASFFKFLIAIIFTINIYGQEIQFPIPSGNPKQLFYLQRTTNKNTIVCELNYRDSVFNKKNPIHVYWIRYEERGQLEELGYFQKKFAYGIKVKSVKENKYEMHFVSLKKVKMDLIKMEDNQYRVFVNVNHKRMILHSIYIDLVETKKLKPDIKFLELTGIDTSTKLRIKERLKF